MKSCGSINDREGKASTKFKKSRPTLLSRAGLSSTGLGSRLRLEHDLDAVVHLVVEDVEAVRRVVEPHAVRDDERRVDLAVLDVAEQLLPVALDVALARPHRQRALHERADGELVDEAAVDADDRDRPAVAA